MNSARKYFRTNFHHLVLVVIAASDDSIFEIFAIDIVVLQFVR